MRNPKGRSTQPPRPSLKRKKQQTFQGSGRQSGFRSIRHPNSSPGISQSSFQSSSAGSPHTRAQKSSVRAWGYQEAQKYTVTNGISRIDKALWLLFFALLALVVLFSQRSWLLWLFPLPSSKVESVQIIRHEALQNRPSEKNAKSQTASSIQSAEQKRGEKGRQGSGQSKKPEQKAKTTSASQPIGNWFGRLDSLFKLGSHGQQGANALALAQVPPREPVARLRDVRLFFVRVQEDGIFELKSVLHKVSFDRTPLSRTVEQLLKGPSPQEINKGLHSMLPPELQVLGIRIIRTTVFLDFNTAFLQIARLPEVLLAAVRQLVFTLTEYPNVKFLRILIEGQPIFDESLPQNTVAVLRQKGVDLNSELRREDLWQGKADAFTP